MLHQPATHQPGQAIDALSRPDALRAMLDSHVAAARAVADALPAIDQAADAMARTLGAGGVVVYAAAGSSGLMALADASELAGTFGVPVRQVRIVMAGGVPVDARMPGDTEDETDTAIAAARTLGAGDLAIVISASGTTPFACAFAAEARVNGCTVVAIANRDGSHLLDMADIAIALPTPPEVVDGSTRLGAATAQKIALNLMSTQAGILTGQVHDGMMVNLNPDNIKLRKRAAGIVARVAGVPGDAAEHALRVAGHDVKQAVLIAAGAAPDRVAGLLADAGGRLRDALARLNNQ